MKGHKPRNPVAPYFVMMRDYERGLLRDALVFNNGNIAATGRMLGISHALVRTRARTLGGVFTGDPIIEPEPNAKSDHEHLAAEGSNPNRDQAADDGPRAADRVDDSQAGNDHDQQ
jgi:hypothetical protein